MKLVSSDVSVFQTLRPAPSGGHDVIEFPTVCISQRSAHAYRNCNTHRPHWEQQCVFIKKHSGCVRLRPVIYGTPQSRSPNVIWIKKDVGGSRPHQRRIFLDAELTRHGFPRREQPGRFRGAVPLTCRVSFLSVDFISDL